MFYNYLQIYIIIDNIHDKLTPQIINYNNLGIP